MEQFYIDRENDFQEWYDVFGQKLYSSLSEKQLRAVWNSAYTLGALQNSKKGN